MKKKNIGLLSLSFSIIFLLTINVSPLSTKVIKNFPIIEYRTDGKCYKSLDRGWTWKAIDNNANKNFQLIEYRKDGKYLSEDRGWIWTKINKKEDIDFNFQLFPNPVSDNCNINIEICNEGNWKIEILNLIGEIEYTQNVYFNTGYNSIKLDLKSLSKATYLVKISKGYEFYHSIFIVN